MNPSQRSALIRLAGALPNESHEKKALQNLLAAASNYGSWPLASDPMPWIAARNSPGPKSGSIIKIWATKDSSESLELFMFDTATNLVGVFMDGGYGPSVRVSPEPFASLSEARKWAKMHKSIRGEGKFILNYFGIPS